MALLAWFFFSGVLSCLAADSTDIHLKIGESAPIESPNYPMIPAQGTSITWQLSTEEGARIKIECEDLRITPTNSKIENDTEARCKNGYVKFEGEAEKPNASGKLCDSLYGIIAKSKENKLSLTFALQNTLGVMKCEAKAYKPNGNSDEFDDLED